VADDLVPGFLETTDFLAGEDTESQARAVIEAFLKHIVEELYRSSDQLAFHANRQELLHRETQDRIVQHLDASLSSSQKSNHAPIQNRTVSQLTISDYAGVCGEATITFGALTLVCGTLKLSHTICDLLRIFSEKEQFGLTQPAAPTLLEYSAASGGTLRQPSRTFMRPGVLRLARSDGNDFIVTIRGSGTTLSVGDTTAPVFSPVVKTISPRKFLATFSDQEDGSVEKKLASHLDISVEDLKACIDGVPTDTSVFGYDYFYEDELRVRPGSKSGFQTVASLSGGEQSRLLLDLTVRISRYRSKLEPIVLLVDQSKIFMDPEGWACFLEWLERKRPPFQTVVDLYTMPPIKYLAHARCYEVIGDDMDVSAFESRTWNSATK